MTYTNWSNENIDIILKDTYFVRLSDYTLPDGIFKIKCLKDGYEWSVRWNNIYRTIQEKRHACPKCCNHLPLTNADVDKRLEGRNIERVDDFKHTRIKMRFKCKICDHIWKVQPGKTILGHRGCPECGKKSCIENNPRKLTNSKIDEKIKDRPITRIGNCITEKIPILFKCKIDGYEWLAKPDNIIKKTRPTGCPVCGRIKRHNRVSLYKPRLTNEDVDKRLANRNLIRIGEYYNKTTKIEWRCKTCNNIWEATPGNIFNGIGCPACVHKGERLAKELLEKYSLIKFKHHKTFHFNNRRYTVDFYAEHLNRKIVIERQGEQHFRPVNLFGGDLGFKKQKKRDRELRRYCKKNNIEVYEFPYWWSIEELINTIKGI